MKITNTQPYSTWIQQVDNSILNDNHHFLIARLESYRENFVMSYQKWFPHCDMKQLHETYNEAIIIFVRNLKNGIIKQSNNSSKKYVFAIAKNLLTQGDNQAKQAKIITECINQFHPTARQVLKLLLLENKSITDIIVLMNFSDFQSASTAINKYMIKLRRLVVNKLVEWERNERKI